MKRFLTSLSIAIGLSLLYAGIVYAQGETPPAETTAQTGEIASKLAALVAAATVIERIIETIWDFYENNVLVASRLVGSAGSYVRWAQQQVNAAKAALVAGATAGVEASGLEKAFQNAEQRLTEYLKSPVYVSMKKKISMPVGIGLGVLIAFAAQLQMFYLLGILKADSPIQWVDTLITGLVIGTGSAPVHSLIGLLQNTKDTVDAARALYSGKAIAEVTDAIKKLEVQPVRTVREVRRMNLLSLNLPEEALIETLSEGQGTSDLERTARRMVGL